MNKKIFENIPENFNDAYESIIAKSMDKERTMKSFKVLLSAYRPLTIDEMQITLEIDETLNSFSGLDLEKTTVAGSSFHQTGREFILPRVSHGNLQVAEKNFRYSIEIEKAHLLLGECRMACIKFANRPNIINKRKIVIREIEIISVGVILEDN
ncbi:hypothetical protein BGW36DRAFT_363362 [Talaromyces proteolyticus]|uniref:Uncharacterized protein n=1 Tax=Talaromyces proteolyticus TaxID=1131652 RepID=A0AAD4KIH1_9EURO|nr:uncharacterized protein BGW36DRAFT_363362 [Talaromyces proteolyticus]KAH8692370.1 hypothetical protein BGW36DRAFT_363362 [Talaromyces proteolyticus]